jgi:hypothetical protein
MFAPDYKDFTSKNSHVADFWKASDLTTWFQEQSELSVISMQEGKRRRPG